MSATKPATPYRERLCVVNISVPENRLRGLNSDAVGHLADSMRRLGLRVPISVRMSGEDVILVTGLHRLKAAEKLGWETIDAVFCDGDEVDAKLWEIAENLHRSELSPMERAEHIAEWVRLTEEKLVQGGQVSGGRGNKGGEAEAARQLGINRQQIRRSKDIASLPKDTRNRAKAEGWSQKKLLDAARPAKAVPPPPPVRNDVETEDAWITAGIRWWNRGSKEWRERFLDEIDTPAFDRTRAGHAA